MGDLTTALCQLDVWWVINVALLVGRLVGDYHCTMVSDYRCTVGGTSGG